MEIKLTKSSSLIRYSFLLLLAAALLASAAQGLHGQNLPTVVKAEALLATNAVHAGSSAKAAFIAHVASGYHINDHHPSLDYLIPTELRMNSAQKFELQNLVYPTGSKVRFSFSETPLSVYQGTAVILANLKVPPGAAPGRYQLTGKLAYQACNEHACLPPSSVPVTLNVHVVGHDVPLKRIHPDVFKSIDKP